MIILYTQFDRLSNAFRELVVGAGLRVAAGEGRHPRDEIPSLSFSMTTSNCRLGFAIAERS